MQPQTLPELFQWRAQQSPQREAYRQPDSATRVWRSYTWGEMSSKVGQWRTALAQERLPPGARIGLLVPNGIEHVCLDMAAMSLGSVAVPLHLIDNPHNLAYILADSGISLLLVETAELWQALLPLREQFPQLKRVLYLRSTGPVADRGIARSIDDWVIGEVDEGTLPEPATCPSSESLATIVYTSGTTGKPKGVMLSHRNILSNVMAIMEVMPVHEEDVFLSFLPLSHTLERTVGYYLPLAAGASVAFARSVQLLMEDLAAVKPTILVSVPRIYERAYAAVRERVDRRWVTRMLFDLAVESGWQRFERLQGRGESGSLGGRLLCALLDRGFGRPLRALFGGRLRAAVTGGAALTPQVARPFLALGVPLLQGYGMTESSPVIACNTPQDNVPAAVGRPLPGVLARLGDRDELLVHGPNVMLGYWQRPTETAAAVDAEGWLHTGDQARLEAGRLYISGRIKDIIVTSTGEKIAPADLETAIVADPLFEQAVVIGEGRPFLAALVVLSAAQWAQEAANLGLEDYRTADLHSKVATSWLLARLQRTVRTFPSYAMPRAIWVSLEPWTVAAALITPTLKPKRGAIEARFGAEIAALYRAH